MNYATPVVLAQERFEAAIQYAHARLRRHYEGIALLSGGVWEKISMDSHVDRAVHNQLAVIGHNSWLNASQKAFSTIFPHHVCVLKLHYTW